MKTEAERVEFLKTLGLNPDAPNLTPIPTTEVVVAEVASEAPAKTTIRLAPEGMDPRSMPVDQIEFDERLLDGFPILTGDGLAAASAHVFSLYKSHGRDKPRNSLLHRKITTFITNTRRSRETGGMVKEKVKTTKEDRDMAALLASQGVTASELAEALTLLAKSKENASD